MVIGSLRQWTKFVGISMMIGHFSKKQCTLISFNVILDFSKIAEDLRYNDVFLNFPSIK